MTSSIRTLRQQEARLAWALVCPALLYLLISEMIARGDVSTMTHFGFHVAMVITLMSYSIKEGTTEFDERGHVKSTRWQSAIQAPAATGS